MSNYVQLGWTQKNVAVIAVAISLYGCLSEEEGAGFLNGQLVGNAAPQISGVAPGSVAIGANYSFIPTASDADGDALTFSISGTPVWAIFNASTGEISGAPQSVDVGSYADISISVSDGYVNASLAPFSIIVQAISTGSAQLNWTPPTENNDGSALTDLAGYRIYWGTQSGSYTDTITIDNSSISTYRVDNLSPGSYEFVVTAYNLSGAESRFSPTATKQIQ